MLKILIVNTARSLENINICKRISLFEFVYIEDLSKFPLNICLAEEYVRIIINRHRQSELMGGGHYGKFNTSWQRNAFFV